ncbi:RNA-directed DNA polymerase, eukaryota, reverse transcriptase zinc-binding domain protein [Tanacetum coccineum]
MAFLEFYKEKFSCHDSPVILPSMSFAKSLSDSDRHLLDSMISLEEIKNAVWDCGSQKAPGLDGFSFMFVKRYWDIMKIDIQNFVMRFFYSSSFPPVDFEKAFDSVSWRFLDHVMESLGFSSTWRKWIMAGLKSSRASILVNGSPTSEFSLKRGLRQGDPLSPFLFIIVMEGLHIALRDELTANLFQGVKMSSEIWLSHLFYADDVIILSEWNQCDMDNIICILNVFYLASGLKINISMSNLYGVGVSSDNIKSMAACTGCSASNLPFTTWSPIVRKHEPYCNWNSLIERFKIELSGWKATFIFSGRFNSSKSVLGSLGIYYFSIFKVPEAVLKTLESLRALFFGVLQIPLSWKDTWLGDAPLCSRFNRLFRLEKNQNCLVRDRIVNGLWAWDWRRPVNGGRALADLNNLLMDIGSLNVEVDRDCVVSSLSTDGSYSVSFIRKHIDNCMIANSLPSTRWCKIIPRKVNIFMWRLLLDRLPHRLNLSSRGLDIDSILCPVCSEHVESNSHAFFSCSAASNIWRLVRGWCELKIPTLSSCDEWDIWYTSWKASKVEKDRAYVIFAATCWMLWRLE